MKRIFLLKYPILIMIIGIIFFGLANTAKAASIEIYDWEDLNNMRNDLTADYILMNNLDASTPGYDTYASATANGGLGWEPVGKVVDYPANAFTGTFDGQGHAITGLTINRPTEYGVGLFGVAGTGSIINNVGLVGVNINGYYYVGGLVGYAIGNISNCYVTGNMTGDFYAAGLVGASSSSSNISNCYTMVDVTKLEGECIAGFIGDNSGTISNSYSTGSVNGNFYVGGFAGNNEGTISNSYSTGSVVGNTAVGSFIGLLNTGGSIENTYANGSVNGTNYVGGLVGYTKGSVINSYSTSSVIGTTNIGGMVGMNNGGTSTNSFWDTETSGQATSAGGTGKTTAEMKSLSTFNDIATEGLDATWDIASMATYIDETWFIDNTNDYPKLGWEYVPSSDSSLSSLSIDQGTLTPVFNSETTSYSASVANDTTNINITPTANNARATITVKGSSVNSGDPSSVALAFGDNTINIVVTAEDDSTSTYTIIVTRESPVSLTRTVIDPNLTKMIVEFEGSFITIAGTDPTNTESFTLNANYIFFNEEAKVTIPAGTTVTKTGGGNIDLTSFTTVNNTIQLKDENGDVLGSIQIGIPNIPLTFSQPITITIPVGEEYNGETLDVFYRIRDNDEWEEEITCEVSSGKCIFQTTHATTFMTEEQPQNAKITSWEAEQYTNPNAKCTNRLKLTIKGKHFDKNATVKIGNKEASSVEKKDKNKLVAKFCLDKLLNIKTDLERNITVTNPDADKKKAKKEINLSDFTNNPNTANTNNSSEYIKSIQRKLVELNLLEERYITGFYGPITTEAVRKFQEQNGIQQTGSLGPETKSKLLGG